MHSLIPLSFVNNSPDHGMHAWKPQKTRFRDSKSFLKDYPVRKSLPSLHKSLSLGVNVPEILLFPNAAPYLDPHPCFALSNSYLS